MKKEIPKRDSKNSKNSLSLTSLLRKCGFILPTTAEEIEEYDKLFIKTDIILPIEVDSPDFLFEQEANQEKVDDNIGQSKKVIKTSIVPIGEVVGKDIPAKNDYFKKLVLAAEIANQLCDEPTFGHKKFVKVYYLCEQVCDMKLSTNYGKYAAGPLDPKNMYTIDAQFRNRKWFVVKQREQGYGYKYLPGENLNQYKQYYPRYFSKQADLIDRIIDLFRKENSDFCEIIATIFFIWNKALINQEIVNDNILINHFYDWGEEKRKFPEKKLIKAIEWMKKEQIVLAL